MSNHEFMMSMFLTLSIIFASHDIAEDMFLRMILCIVSRLVRGSYVSILVSMLSESESS